MVKYKQNLDDVFGALADVTRRDILRRLSREDLTVGRIAEPYQISLPAISKHLNVLEKAGLVGRKKIGREQFVRLIAGNLCSADEYLAIL